MRKQGKKVIWPVYFDITKTIREGRKVSRKIAVPNPTLLEIHRIAERLGFKLEAQADAAHSAAPWRKTGRLLVESKDEKKRILTKIAKEILVFRQQEKK